MIKTEPKTEAQPSLGWTESEALATRHLAAARFLLPEDLPSSSAKALWASVEHHLYRRELKLALDCAMSLGNDVGAEREYWRELLLATRSMELDEHASKLAELIRLQRAQ